MKETRTELVKRVVRENARHDEGNGKWRRGLAKVIADMQKEADRYNDEHASKAKT